jgi:hypothetical protein
MNTLRAYLVLVFACLGAYTLWVGSQHGWNLLPVFFLSIAEASWSGQFNLDFMCLLGLSGAWVAWRHHFTSGGLALGVATCLGGMLFLAPYLLWASMQAAGDAQVLLLGKGRGNRSP